MVPLPDALSNNDHIVVCHEPQCGTPGKGKKPAPDDRQVGGSLRRITSPHLVTFGDDERVGLSRRNRVGTERVAVLWSALPDIVAAAAIQVSSAGISEVTGQVSDGMAS
jgi:hypothetical protein